jgi:hypothetical protein
VARRTVRSALFAAVEESLEVTAAQADLVSRSLAHRGELAPGAPGAHGLTMHAGEPGGL